MAKQTKPVISLQKYNNICIVGENVLYNNGTITAFYLLPLSNYTTNNVEGVMNTVQKIRDLIDGIVNSVNPKVLFTIERTDKVLRVQDVLSNMYDTIRIYRPDFDMPIEFTKNIEDDIQSYCILGVDIQQSTLTEVEDLTIIDTFKALFKGLINRATGLGNLRMDPEQILKIEESIYRAVKDRCMRCTKDLVFYNFVSKLFPCYEISYDKLSYINENSFEDIMGSVVQTVSDNFGWFEMHNEGMDIFGQDPVTTYGCMLNVREFPAEIDVSAFPMDYVNVVTTIQCLTKEEAKQKFRRIRASDRFERNEGLDAGAEIEDIQSTQDSIDLATHAIKSLEDESAIVCQFNTSILVFAETREELKQRIMSVVNSCKSRNILLQKSLTQALDFLNVYVSKMPKKFSHLAPLEFPLSFQQNACATVGDTADVSVDSEGRLWWSPAIGDDLM